LRVVPRPQSISKRRHVSWEHCYRHLGERLPRPPATSAVRRGQRTTLPRRGTASPNQNWLLCARCPVHVARIRAAQSGRSVLLVEGGCRRHDLARRRMICLRDTVMHPGCLSARALPGRCGRPAITFVVCNLMNPAPSLRCSCRCGQTTHPRRRAHPWTRSSACERTSGPISVTRSGTWPTPPARALSFSARRGRGAVPPDQCRRACALARPA
jgi:hypothetical protein